MIDNDENERDDFQALGYKYRLCKNGDQFLKYAQNCHEYYDEYFIQKNEKELHIRKKSKEINNETFIEESEPISSDVDDLANNHVNNPSFTLNKILEFDENDKRKKLKKVRARTPNKIKLIEYNKNIEKPKRVRTAYNKLSNNQKKASTNDYREKSVGDLIEIFKNRIKDDFRKEELENLCKNIENELYKQLKNRKEYNDKIILIKKNLINPENGSFYKKILTGEIKPEDLPTMETSKMASDKVIEERLNEEQKELKRIEDHSNELNATKARIYLSKAINKGLYGLNKYDCKEFMNNQAKLAELSEAVIVNSINEKVFSILSKKTPDKIRKLIDQNLSMRIRNDHENHQPEPTKTGGKQKEDVTPKSKIMKSNSWANKSPNKNNGEISRQVSLNRDFKIPKIVTKGKNECNSESSINLADIEPKRVLLDGLNTLASKYIFININQDELNAEKLEENTSLDENHANLNFSLVLNTNSENDKNKISSRTDEFWTGQIETQEDMLSAKVVSLYNSDHFYHNKFYSLLKNCFKSNIKSIRSKQVQKCCMFSHLDKLVGTRSHYFSILKLEPFESTEFKNSIKIMGEEIKKSASEMYKTFIEKLAILNKNKSYLEMEIPEHCSNLISNFIIFSLEAKNGETDHFFQKLFGLKIQKDRDSLMCVIVSKNKDNLFKKSREAFEKENLDNVTNNEIFVNQKKYNNAISNEKKAADDLSKFISNKRKNDSVDTCSNDCKKSRLESFNSRKSSKINSQERSSSNSIELSKRSSAGHRHESDDDEEEKKAERRFKERNVKITGLDLTDYRKEDRLLVESLFKYLDDDINKIQLVYRKDRNNVIVELRNKYDSKSLFQNANKLRNSTKYKNVYINRDLTHDDQLIETRDRLNLKNTSYEFYYEIVHGKIEKILRNEKNYR